MNVNLPTNQPGTLLGVWAHPDDEAYLSGGLMAAATGAGRRVVVVTATYGELGTSDPERWHGRHWRQRYERWRRWWRGRRRQRAAPVRRSARSRRAQRRRRWTAWAGLRRSALT